MPGPDLVYRLAPYPELVRVHEAAESGDWPALRSAYAALNTIPLQTAAVRVVGETNESDLFLAPVANTPGDSDEQLLARTMLAARYIEVGWAIRTGYSAKHVSAEQFRLLREWLCRAETLLVDVIARQPENVPAWNLRLTTARGLELGQSEVRRRYDHADRYEPHHLTPQLQLVQQLCPKWSGTVEQLHAFARQCAQAAPPGALSPVAIVSAHLEHWSDLSGPEADAYLYSLTVQNDVALAATQSVLHPAFQPVYGWALAHGYFALYQSMVGNHAAAAVHFRAGGDFDLSQPWTYFYGRPEEKYREHRAAALAKG